MYHWGEISFQNQKQILGQGWNKRLRKRWGFCVRNGGDAFKIPIPLVESEGIGGSHVSQKRAISWWGASSSHPGGRERTSFGLKGRKL